MTSSTQEALSAYIEKLHREFEVWYAKSVRRYYRAYYALQLTILTSGFVTSVLIALGDLILPHHENRRRVILVAVSSIGTLAAALLVQFRVHDLWRLREEGRIAFQDLVLEGRRRMAAAKTEEDCALIYSDLQAATHYVEKTQSNNFFGTTPFKPVEFGKK